MTRHVLARRSAIGLGVTYVLLGVAQTVRLTVTGDGGFVYWFGTWSGAVRSCSSARCPARRDAAAGRPPWCWRERYSACRRRRGPSSSRSWPSS